MAEEPSIVDRLAALEILARAALRSGPEGALVAARTAMSAGGLSTAAAISGDPERVRFVSGMCEALKGLFRK